MVALYLSNLVLLNASAATGGIRSFDRTFMLVAAPEDSQCVFYSLPNSEVYG